MKVGLCLKADSFSLATESEWSHSGSGKRAYDLVSRVIGSTELESEGSECFHFF